MTTAPLGHDDYAWPDPRHGPWQVKATWHAIDGKAVVSALEVVSDPAIPLSSHVLRQIHQHLMTERLAKRHRTLQKIARNASKDVAARARRQIDLHDDRTGKPGPKPRGVEHYQRVAELVLEANAKGLTASRYVATQMQTNPSTARNWMATARRLGLLGDE